LTLGALTQAALAQETLWVRRLDLGADEFANGIASRGNTIVAVGYRAEAGSGDWLVVRLSQSGDTLWTRTLDFGPEEYAIDASIDREGNVLVAGHSVVYAGRCPRPSPWHWREFWPTLAKDQQFFALTAKFDSAGGLKWQRVDTNHLAMGIATDSAGNCYVSGTYYDGAVFDLWLAKLNPSGETIWTRRLDLAPVELGYRLALDASGNIVVALYFGDFANLDCGAIKLSPDGETLWTGRCDMNIEDAGIGIATDHESNVIVTGFTGNTGVYDFLVLKFDSAGTLVWQKSFDRDEDDEALGAACDSAGTGYVTGITGSFMQYDCWTMKLNPVGETLWTTTYGGSADDEAADVACDSAGNPIIVGTVTDTVTYYYDLLAIKYQPFVGIAEPRPTDHDPRTTTSSTITATPDIVLAVPLSGHYDIKLCDLCGTVRQEIYSGQLAQGAHRFSLTEMPAGLYFIRVAMPDGRVSGTRLILVR